MMNMQWSIVLIVLSTVQIYTAFGLCPASFDMCQFADCGNGTCVSNNTIDVCFHCDCYAGFTGNICDIPINTQPGCILPCQNGGQCSMTGATQTCICPSSYMGPTCETLISSSGTLSPGITSPGVPATTGFGVPATTGSGVPATTGSSFVTLIPGSCASRQCLNGGSCYNTGNSFFCHCKQPYSGPTCNLQSAQTTGSPTPPINPTPCTPNPCGNGGTCYRNGNSFVCACTSYYTGALCDTQKSPAAPATTASGPIVTCASQPCRNGATCYNSGNSYFCYCGANSGYTGKNCDEAKSASNPNCPMNCLSGYCIRTGNSGNPYACICDGVLTPTPCSR